MATMGPKRPRGKDPRKPPSGRSSDYYQGWYAYWQGMPPEPESPRTWKQGWDAASERDSEQGPQMVRR